MQYVSLLYLLGFLPVVVICYGLLPQRHRWKLLLAASYVFFFLLSKKLVAYLFFSTLTIHEMGLWLTYCDTALEKALPSENEESDKAAKDACARKKRGILWLGILMNIGLLLLLKYSSFFGENVNTLLDKVSISARVPVLTFLVPIGISFYSLQAVSYIADVYHKRIPADDNLGRLALYLAFFPTIMEGPICRYSNDAEDLYAGKPLEYQNVAFGVQRIVWGLFKKLVIADRLNILVGKIFDGYTNYSGLMIVLGAVCYTTQLYADFSGCIDVTIGTGQIFGVTIPENFRQPFFSRTASEFWRRWHITLGTWFKDYIFYPLSLTHAVKTIGKKARKKFGRHIGQTAQTFLPMLAVWLCNGLWHGVGWQYIFFGLYYFVLILIGNLWEPAAVKIADTIHLSRNGIPWRAMQTVKMALVIFTGELFFRANGLAAGLSMFRSIFTKNFAIPSGTLSQLGLDRLDYITVIAGVLLVFVVGILHESGISIRKKIAGFHLPVRWAIYIGAILLVVIFGAYGEGYLPVDPLYAGF